MEVIIAIVLILWFLGSTIFYDPCAHCHRRRGGFFSHHGCDCCPENEGCGCLAWIIGAIILLAIFS